MLILQGAKALLGVYVTRSNRRIAVSQRCIAWDCRYRYADVERGNRSASPNFAFVRTARDLEGAALPASADLRQLDVLMGAVEHRAACHVTRTLLCRIAAW